MALMLQAVDVAGPWRWRWLLTKEHSRRALADQRVQLDPDSAEVAAFADLYGHARWNAAPDRRMADEALAVHRAGEWAGRALLGEQVGAKIVAAARSGVTVRVSVPPPLEHVLGWPLELAHVAGRPLAARGDVSLVYDIGAVADDAKDPVAGTLRVLALFSQPTDTSVVALRRARYALARLIRRLAARGRAAIELRVVQYGASRQRLAEICDDGAGWDVLQLWGHGGRGLFLLEHPDGSPDPVDVADLIGLLRPMRSRVKLAVVSACESAAGVTAQTMRLIGLDDGAARLEAAERDRPRPAGLAQALAAELDCAVVGMRYPVTDEFAIAFGDGLYEQLLTRGQPLDTAVARAVAAAAGPAPSPARPAVSLGTAGLFGGRAIGLRLAVPRGVPRLDPADARMAFFPAEPARFVGRAAVMAAASAALAADSGRTAVLLHGMAGAGKTACALELAYRHQDSSGVVAFWQAPARDEEWAGALASLAAALEVQLGEYGFSMAAHIGSAAALAAYLPRLRRVLADNAVLLVLDNLESLLTPEGTWRDPSFGQLIAAFRGHDGESRLIMTSRILPGGLGPEVLTLPVHALSLDEAVALARELPSLRGLIYADAEADRNRVLRVLRVVQGHPKLLELADAAAVDRARLDNQLSAAEAAITGQRLETFFREGASELAPGDFLTALSGWTTTALTVLPAPARLLAQFLACFEDNDRQDIVIAATWGHLWQLTGRPGPAPDPAPLLDLLAAAALIAPVRPPPGQPAPVGYQLHPGVAAAIGAATAGGVRDAADAALAVLWGSLAIGEMAKGDGEDTGMLVQAALAAMPYLLRRRDWTSAGVLMERVVYHDESPATVAAALPVLRRIAAATGAPATYVTLGLALSRVDPVEAGQLLRTSLDTAVRGRDWGLASSAAGHLLNLAVDAGRLDQALEYVTRKADYTKRAGRGPWTQLLDQAQRLQILELMGGDEALLSEFDKLLAQLRKLPAPDPEVEAVDTWRVREGILDTGRRLTFSLRKWRRCLDLNAEILAGARQRGAGPHELARIRYRGAESLIALGRLAEAGKVLRDCQQVFETERDIQWLAMVFGSRAELELKRGHPTAAVELQRTSIRLSYGSSMPQDIATRHADLARALHAAGTDPDGQRTHLLAAALIDQLTDMTDDLAVTKRLLAGAIRDGRGARVPATLADLVQASGQTEGVRLGELVAELAPDTATAEEALAQILHNVRP